ncbi:NAD(P)H-dependent oxidoreductase [Candidatus Acetothermia bacterium]|nr:NAD(P)H-dependent oxidoreductase [Candidatus Acetothermia bacterium]
MPSQNKPLHILGIGGSMKANSTSLWALERALKAAQATGATTELLASRDLNLPIYSPSQSFTELDTNTKRFLNAVRKADAFIWSTPAYHGTIAGVVKNALDFIEFLSDDPRPYIHNKVVGLIATAGGDLAAVNAINAMVHVTHAIRGIPAPLLVAIPQAWKVFDKQGKILEEKWAGRLDQLGQLVVEMATKFQPAEEPQKTRS